MLGIYHFLEKSGPFYWKQNGLQNLENFIQKLYDNFCGVWKNPNHYSFSRFQSPIKENRAQSNSSPGSSRYSKWRCGEAPGTRCKILHESWSILSRDTFDFRLRYTFPSSNMAVYQICGLCQGLLPWYRHWEYREDPGTRLALNLVPRVLRSLVRSLGTELNRTAF